MKRITIDKNNNRYVVSIDGKEIYQSAPFAGDLNKLLYGILTLISYETFLKQPKRETKDCSYLKKHKWSKEAKQVLKSGE